MIRALHPHFGSAWNRQEVHVRLSFFPPIRQMSVEDAKDILSGPEDAATQYFRANTGDALTAKMRPIVESATAGAGVTSTYKRMMERAGGLTVCVAVAGVAAVARAAVNLEREQAEAEVARTRGVMAVMRQLEAFVEKLA